MEKRLQPFIIAVMLFATGAQAGITSIVAHSVTYAPGSVIPVVADVNNSIVVKGQWMDLSTGVESSDPSFTVKTGRRTGGADTSLEVLVGAGAATDLARSTIHIKFLSGQETFTVEAFKTRVNSLELYNVTTPIPPTCQAGENVSLIAKGEGMANLVIGTSGAMLDVANAIYKLNGKIPTTITNAARFSITCTAPGQFTVDRTWFADSRVSGLARNAMVRGAATLTVTVTSAPPPTKVKQLDAGPSQEPKKTVLPPSKK